MSSKMKLDFGEGRNSLETAILLDGVEETKPFRKDNSLDMSLGSMNFIRRKRRLQNSVSLDSAKLTEKQVIVPDRLPKGMTHMPRFIQPGKNMNNSPIMFDNVRHQHKKFLSDFFTTCIDAKWRWISILFSSSFIVSWMIFGTLWWLIVYLRQLFGSKLVCVDNVDSWTAAFLFSLETQTTIGYGGRQVTPYCPEGVVLVVLQSIIGLFITCSMLGLTFAKLSRPKNRANTVVFSNKAVIALRDSKLCLMFRLADIRKRKLYDCNVRAVLIHSKITKEGEFIPFHMSDLALTIDQQQIEYTIRLFPIIPLTVIHLIDDSSPLYDISSLELARGHVEVVVILEGTVPHTGMVTQALKSYTSKEIEWGYRFTDMLNGRCYMNDAWKVDFSRFHDTYKDTVTPLVSARELGQIDEESDSNGYQTGSSTASAISSYHANTLIVPDSVAIDIDSKSLSTIPMMKETEA